MSVTDSQPGRTHGFLPITFRVVTSLSVMTFVFNYYLLSMLLCLRECFEEELGINPWASRMLGKSSTVMLLSHAPKDPCFVVVLVTWCLSEPGASCIFGRCSTVVLCQPCSKTVWRSLSVYFETGFPEPALPQTSGHPAFTSLCLHYRLVST